MLQAEGLIKRFGGRAAVSGVSLQVAAGSICGFLGPNGAGKSTTIRMLVGVLPPDAGSVRVGGASVWSAAEGDRARRAVGWLPERAPVHADATVEGFLAWAARLHGVPGCDIAERVRAVVDQCQLGEVRRRLCGALSRGYRQRVGLAAAMVHRPSLLVLDEPTAGMDPAQVLQFRSLLGQLRGTTAVLLSTHVLAEVEAACDTLVVLDRGRMVATGTPAEVRGALGVGARLELEVDDGVRAEAALQGCGLRILSRTPCADGTWTALVAEGTVTPEIRGRVSQFLARDGVAVRRLDAEHGPLEEAFRRLTQESA
jgi:ABC-2 type transport system ATP-binding protein